MTNNKLTNQVYKLEELTETQRRALNKVLEILSPAQLLNLALRIKSTDFGRIFIEVKNNSPRFIGQEKTDEFPNDMDDDTLQALLDRQSKPPRTFNP